MSKRSKSVVINVEGAELKISSGEFTVQIHTPLPDEHNFYAVVGRVASEWSHLEHILDLIIHDLANSRSRGVLPANVLACVTSQIMGVGPRCKVIILLGGHCRLDNKTLLKPFRTLMSDSYTVADERARFVHDPWYLDIDSKAPSQFRAMPYSDPVYGFKEIDGAHAVKVIGRIRGLRDRAAALRNAVLGALQSSSEKPSSG